MADVTITSETVRRIANLARLELSEDEVKRFTGQLANIVDAVGVLNEVNTDDVVPTAQVTGLTNVFETDSLNDFVADKSRLLGQVQGEIVDNQILVPPVF